MNDDISSTYYALAAIIVVIIIVILIIAALYGFALAVDSIDRAFNPEVTQSAITAFHELYRECMQSALFTSEQCFEFALYGQ